METHTFSYQDLPKIIDRLYALLPNCRMVTFTGPLGAGKTTIIRQLLRRCGVTVPITSPTFTYVNVYENDKGHTFYHFDLYRIGFLDEFIAAGFDEMLYQPNSWALIEWPEVIEPLLHKKSMCSVSIDYGEQAEQRMLNIYN